MPNGLSQSNVGIKWKEQVAPDWFFIGDVNFGFDPYSLHFADGPRSLAENNNNIPAFFQIANGDSSRTYGPINTRAYAGYPEQDLRHADLRPPVRVLQRHRQQPLRSLRRRRTPSR